MEPPASLFISSSNLWKTEIMKKIYIVMAVLATAALASCQQEKSFNEETLGENSVVFTVRGGGATRADVTPEVRQGVIIPLETEDGSSFFLEETVVDLNEFTPATKGAPAYTENLGKLSGYDLGVYAAEGSFGTATYEKMDNDLYPRKDASQGEGWRYQHNYNGDPWPDESTKVGFYLNMPAAPTGVSITGRTGGKFTFTYTSPAKAADQQDILFAYRSMTKEEHMGFLPNGAPVLFQHALTGVKFRIGNEAADITKNGIAITEVIFNNLINTGTCEISPSAETNYTDNKTNYSSAGVTSWPTNTKSSTGAAIRSDAISGTVDYTSGDFGDSWYSAGNTENLNKADGSQTFWLIPQTFAANSAVTLTIKYTFGGQPGEWTIDFGKVLGAKSVEWKAGELRTYTLRVDDVNVMISDEVNLTKTTTADGVEDYKNSTKTNVQIKNTSNTDSFIRASIIGQWLDVNGDPVFGFTDFTNQTVVLVESWYQDQFVKTEAGTHGKFTGLAGYKGGSNPLNKWYYNSADGYYYYTDPVAAGEYVPSNLFTSYTVLDAPDARVAGEEQQIYFQLEISTQAISAKKVDGSYYTYTEAWANAYAQ